MSNPKYGGLLELNESPLFIDLISYNGSSVDPHKIFIAKNMTSITRNIGSNKILASLKEIPYISRDYAVHLLNILKNIGFSIYKIGKPRELTYNAKVDNYNFGVVAGSGLNLIAALKEKGIDVEVKAIAKLMKFENGKTVAILNYSNFHIISFNRMVNKFNQIIFNLININFNSWIN